MRLIGRGDGLLEDTVEDEDATWILSRRSASGIKRVLELPYAARSRPLSALTATRPFQKLITSKKTTKMHRLSLILTITTLALTALAAPASPSHSLETRAGPCDAYSETCRPVLQANACFAAFVMFGTKEQVLQCVDDQDPVNAEEVVSTMQQTLVDLGFQPANMCASSCARAMDAPRRRCRIGPRGHWGARPRLESEHGVPLQAAAAAIGWHCRMRVTGYCWSCRKPSSCA
jgi:hypothetical protein